MSSVRWTEEAAADLASIRSYIERDSPQYARLVVERLVEKAKTISLFPERGRVVPELGRSDIRELIFGSYRIVYWLDDDAQHILTIFRSSRLFPLSEDDLP